MFTKEDYQNLLVFLSRTPFNGLQEAAVAFALAEKLRKAMEPEKAE